MYPTLFRIGHFSLSTYGVLIALAFLAAAQVTAKGMGERGLKSDHAWTLALYALAGGFLGAKIYYVLLHGDASAFLSRGGFVWYGGLIGGAASVLWFIRREGLPLSVAADALAPALPLGHAIGHLGCFFSGDSYGLPSNLPWAVAFKYGAPPSTAGALRNEFGVSLPASLADDALVRVHPTMLYSALALLIIFLVLWSLRRRPLPSGWLFGLYLALSGTERFLVEFVRAKDDRFLWGFSTAQAIAALSIVLGLGLLIFLKKRRSQKAPGRAGASGDRSPAPAHPPASRGAVETS
ncbi:MAG: prolipoprotein diacylglyceryl transferase [Gemmatimonadota bacterium]